MKRLLFALALLLALVGVVFIGLTQMAEKVGSAHMEALAAQVSPYAGLTWRKLSVKLLSRSLVLRDVHIVSKDDPDLAFDARRVLLQKSEENRWQAEFSALKPAPATAVRLAEALGCDPEELHGSLEGDVSWDPASSALTVHDLRLSMPGLFAFRLSGTAANLPQLAGSAQTLAVQSVFTQVGGLSAAYSDHSLVDRLLRREADRLGADQEAWRKAMADILENDLQAYAGRAPTAEDKAFLAATAQALRAFLARPGTLELTVAPRQPMPVVEILLFPPLEAARRLNLKVEAR